MILIVAKISAHYATNQTSFIFLVEVIVTCFRMVILHVVDQVDQNFWIIEATNISVNLIMRNYIQIVNYFELGFRGNDPDQNEKCNQEYLSFLLMIYTFGISVLMLLFAKDHDIEGLKMKLRIKDDLI
jgi:hypothetical protein